MSLTSVEESATLAETFDQVSQEIVGYGESDV